ncbi:hypothetical protein QN277_016269 [Acacia crassicarpa]|uniref:hAT-like transposase RNase-H fold domain-containing protein n=1 Tax=Acacia crassicarpa TaxID=499986 RepID=A0AAE1TBA9_9FABA|nr:hypothetical protein QN277_016269 [Acacia crassicarpa]
MVLSHTSLHALSDIYIYICKITLSNEVPFRCVEKEGLTELCQEFQPKFQMPSRWTAARDCYGIYKEQANILTKYFKTSKVHVSFTTDCWTSMQNNNYMCLTAHWIDDDWILQKRILNFCEIKDHRGESIAKQIEDCLFQWGIDKVFTIIVDNATANDSAIAILKMRFKSWDGFAMVCDWEFLQMRCAAHILNLVVSEGLKEMNKSIELIRHAVKYVKSSPSRKRKFIMLAERERVESKSLLTLDCPTRWNSTYLMLESAVKFVKVFTWMEEEDEEYKQYFKKKNIDSSRDTFILIDAREGVDDVLDDTTTRRSVEPTIMPPSAYDWSTANEFLGFLKLFYNMTLKFSRSNYVTSNTCFQHIVSIQTSLESNANSSHSLLGHMSRRMLSKFNKYWGSPKKMNPLLVVAVILDPRYKLTYVKVAFANLFHEPTKCEAMLRKITTLLYHLYDHYSTTVHVGESSSQPTSEQGDHVELELEVPLASGDATFQKFLTQANAESNVEKISEVDEYLRAELIGYRDSKFDLLAWWKANACKYKVLSLRFKKNVKFKDAFKDQTSLPLMNSSLKV